MEKGPLIGLTVAIIALIIPMSSGGQLRGFIDPVSAVLVLGGTVAATLLNFPLSQVLRAWRNMRAAFYESNHSPRAIGNLLVQWSESARRQGVLSLETYIEEAPLPVMSSGLQRVVDGATPDTLRSYMEIELDMIEERTAKDKAVFDAMAAYAPAFGMIGTIVGLINMLLTMKDPSTLGASMGLALVTTFYGAVLANVVFMPVSGKMQARCDEEVLLGQMAIHALVAIAAGENPKILSDTLSVFYDAAGSPNEPEMEPVTSQMGAS